MYKRELLYITLIIFLFLVILSLILYISPSFVINVVAGLSASILFAIVIFIFRKISIFLSSQSLNLWASGAEVIPPFNNRIKSPKTELFIVGFTLEGLLNNSKNTLMNALGDNQDLNIKLLMLNHTSSHVTEHNKFSDRDIEKSNENVISQLKHLYDRLSSNERKRLDVRCTNYLPRFSATIVDNETMLIIFYLYNSRAYENPAIEICLNSHKEAFNKIHGSLNGLFEHDSNHKIIDNGEWKGINAAL